MNEYDIPMMTPIEIKKLADIESPKCCENCIVKMLDCTDLCSSWYKELFKILSEKYNMSQGELYEMMTVWLNQNPV